MDVIAAQLITLGCSLLAYMVVNQESRNRGWAGITRVGVFLAIFGATLSGMFQLWALFGPHPLLAGAVGSDGHFVVGLITVAVLAILILDLLGKIDVMASLRHALESVDTGRDGPPPASGGARPHTGKSTAPANVAPPASAEETNPIPGREEESADRRIEFAGVTSPSTPFALFAGACAMLVLLGSFGEWYDLQLFDTTIAPTGGMDPGQAGRWTATLAGIAIILLLARGQVVHPVAKLRLSWVVIGAFGLLSVLGVHNWFDASSKGSDVAVASVSIGWGLMLLTTAAIAGVLCSSALMRADARAVAPKQLGFDAAKLDPSPPPQ